MLTLSDHLLSLYEEDPALISLLHVEDIEAIDYDSVDDHYRVTFSARAAWTEYGEAQGSSHKTVHITLLYDYDGSDPELLEIFFQYEDDDDDFVPLRYTCPLTMRIFSLYETLLVQFLDAIGVR
ncbi:MAG: hypothetical protein Q4A06_04010 [Cardiobacteriaceae bacterium]|nr:hypothetical protein [Cardiobacteriaceae bacterium]